MVDDAPYTDQADSSGFDYEEYVAGEHDEQEPVDEAQPARFGAMLAVDVGSINTRVVFFDVVNGSYRFVGSSTASSTLDPPYVDAAEGMRNALHALTGVIGRRFLSDDENENEDLVIPTDPDTGIGVNIFGATASAGRPLKVLLAGLMPDVSLESARRIANTAYMEVVDTLRLGDRRTQAQQIEAIRKAEPDIVLLSGGTEGGAVVAVMRLAETIALGCYMMDAQARPFVVYAGNGAIRDQVQGVFEGIAEVSMTTNLRPGLGREILDPARRTLAQTYSYLRAGRVPGYANLIGWSQGYLTPTAQSFGYAVRYLSQREAYTNGVLGVDLGSANTAVVAAYEGKLSVKTHTDLGVGHSIKKVLDQTSLANLARWLPVKVSGAQIRDYIYNKMLGPQTVPHTKEDLYLEQAIAREALRLAIERSQPGWFDELQTETGDLPEVDLIIGTGAALGQAPRIGEAALMLIDALQPMSVTNLVLDAPGIASALGATALYNPLAMVQILDESPDFSPIATVVSVSGHGRDDQPAVTVKITPKGGKITEVDVNYGAIRKFRLPLGKTVEVSLRPKRGFDVGSGRGQNRTLTLIGNGVLGLIVDARGRPLSIPADANERIMALRSWLKAVGAPVGK